MAQNVQDSVTVVEKDIATHRDHTGAVEVDSTWNDDVDDEAGETSYATSLASSVQNYPVEHGRRYHAFRAERSYSRPNDEQEMDRLLLIHDLITHMLGGLYKAPIDKDKTKRILDLGTGTGIWAISISEEFPDATIIGNDLSANQPTFIPPNVRFEVDDIEDPWVHPAKFDWIFSRYMVVSITDWPKYVGRVFENLNPGGYCEFQDFDLRYYSDDGSLKPTSALATWIATLHQATDRLGRSGYPGPSLEGWVRGAGFVDIVHKRYKIPLGPWAKLPKLKEAGKLSWLQLNGGLEGMSMRLLTGVMGWNEEEVRVMLEKVRAELKSPKVHALFDLHVVYGRKPE